jgi:hypothetical protein
MGTANGDASKGTALSFSLSTSKKAQRKVAVQEAAVGRKREAVTSFGTAGAETVLTEKPETKVLSIPKQEDTFKVRCQALQLVPGHLQSVVPASTAGKWLPTS